MSITTTANFCYDSDAATWVALCTADGVTDNRALIQATIDHCNTNGGGTIFLPGGTIIVSHGSAYNSGWGASVMNSLTAGLDIKANIHICGTGTTVIKTPSTAPGGSAARMSCLVKPGATNITVTGITFDGSATSADSETASYGFTICGVNTKDVDLVDCEFKNYRGRVLYAVGQDSAFSAGSQAPDPAKWVSRVRCYTNRIKDGIGNGFGFFSAIDCENDLTFQNENLKVPTGGGAEPVICRGFQNLLISRQIMRNWGGGVNLGGNSDNHGEDLTIHATDNTKVKPVGSPPSYTFKTRDIGQTVTITAGTGFTPGTYTITAVDGSSYATLNAAAGTTGSTGGSYSTTAGTTRNYNCLTTDWLWRTCAVESNPGPYTGLNATIRDVDQFAIATSSDTICYRFLAGAICMDERGRYGANSKYMAKTEGVVSALFGQINVIEDSTDYTSYTKSDLVVDAIDNTKVSSATFTFVADHIGLLLEITAGAGWTLNEYRIVAVSAGVATLASSPAAAGTTGGTFLFNNGGGIASIAGDASLWANSTHYRSTFTSDDPSTTPGRSAGAWGAVGTTDPSPSANVVSFNSMDSTMGKRGGNRVLFGNYAQACASVIPTSGTTNNGVVAGNCMILESGTDTDGLLASGGNDATRLSFFLNSHTLNQSSASSRATNITNTSSLFVGIACNHYRNRQTGTNGYYSTGGTTYSVVTNNLYSRSGGTLTVTVGGGGTNANNASFSG